MFEQFYKEAKAQTNQNTVFMILANKSDLKQVVSTDQAQEAALSLGALYLEVSAKNKMNIENIFQIIAAQILNRS